MFVKCLSSYFKSMSHGIISSKIYEFPSKSGFSVPLEIVFVLSCLSLMWLSCSCQVNFCVHARKWLTLSTSMALLHHLATVCSVPEQLLALASPFSNSRFQFVSTPSLVLTSFPKNQCHSPLQCGRLFPAITVIDLSKVNILSCKRIFLPLKLGRLCECFEQ